MSTYLITYEAIIVQMGSKSNETELKSIRFYKS